MAWNNTSGKNAEGYPDPTASEAIRRSMTGRQSRLVGELFENRITGSCNWYKGKGLAYIEKTPEPMKPLRAPNRQGQFLACYTKAGQPDYKGTLSGGRAVVFEAKHTDSDRIERKRLTDEQLDSLAIHAELGAVAFVLVSFGLNRFYRVPWEMWDDMKNIYGRQYIKYTELLDYEVPQVAGIIKFLDGIESEANTK